MTRLVCIWVVALVLCLGCEKKPEPATGTGPRPIPGGAGKQSGAGWEEPGKQPGKR